MKSTNNVQTHKSAKRQSKNTPTRLAATPFLCEFKRMVTPKNGTTHRLMRRIIA